MFNTSGRVQVEMVDDFTREILQMCKWDALCKAGKIMIIKRFLSFPYWGIMNSSFMHAIVNAKTESRDGTSCVYMDD